MLFYTEDGHKILQQLSRTGSLKKGLDPKRHPFLLSRDAASPAELLQYFVSLFHY